MKRIIVFFLALVLVGCKSSDDDKEDGEDIGHVLSCYVSAVDTSDNDVVFQDGFLRILRDDHCWTVLFTSEVVYFRSFSIGEEKFFDGMSYREYIYSSGEEQTRTGCYLREENGKLLWYDDGIDRVLLDFSLELNDTIEVNQQFCSIPLGCEVEPQFLEVVDISTQFIAGKNRKVLEMSGVGNAYSDLWIEGIGSLASVFSPQLADLNCSTDSPSVWCFTEDFTSFTFEQEQIDYCEFIEFR